ncbi:DUF561 domain-containing protein [bacterium]|nr:DUF561 domain-containing protein [bacterium]
MRNMENFKRALSERRALKIIAGMNNMDLDRVRMVVSSAMEAGADAVDVSANRQVLTMVREMMENSNSTMALFASSVNPSELAEAVNVHHVDAIELGNFDALYREGRSFSSMEVLSMVRETLSMIEEHRAEVMFCVTIPGSLSVNDQISLVRELEMMNIDMIQTEGYVSEEMTLENTRTLLNRAELTLSNTIELSRNTELPIMTASNINTVTASMAFAAGASAIGCGSCVNRLESQIQMMAVIKNLREIANRSWNWSMNHMSTRRESLV